MARGDQRGRLQEDAHRDRGGIRSREAPAAELAKEALAQGAFLSWQRFSAFVWRQQEAVSFTAAEDVCTAAPLRYPICHQPPPLEPLLRLHLLEPA